MFLLKELPLQIQCAAGLSGSQSDFECQRGDLFTRTSTGLYFRKRALSEFFASDASPVFPRWRFFSFSPQRKDPHSTMEALWDGAALRFENPQFSPALCQPNLSPAG